MTDESTARQVGDAAAQLMRDFLAEPGSWICGAGLARARELLWRIFERRPAAGPFLAASAVDAAYVMWCCLMACDQPAGASIRLRDHLRSTPERLIPEPGYGQQPLRVVADWIVAVRSVPAPSPLDEAVFALSAGAAAVGDDPAVLACLATARLRRYERDGAAEDLDAAIELLRRAAVGIIDDRLAAIALRRLAQCLLERHDAGGSAADAVEAASALRTVWRRTESERPAVGSLLAFALLASYQSRGEESDLDEANEILDQLVDGSGPVSARIWRELGTARFLRFERRGDDNDLDAAIDAYRTAVAVAPDDADIALANLGGVLVIRSERRGDFADIEESLSVLRSMVARTAPDSPELPSRLANLATSLQAWSLHTGSDAALDEAVSVLQRAIEAYNTNNGKAIALHQLGHVLDDRYDFGGNLSDLDVSIQSYARAVGLAAEDPLSRHLYLSSLGRAMNKRYNLFGVESDSAAAVGALREAIALAPPGDPNTANYLNALAQALYSRVRVRGSRTDLDQVIRYATDAVSAAQVGDIYRGNYFNDLGLALLRRYRIDHVPQDLELAIAAFHDAIDSPGPAGRARPAPYTNLAGALQDKYERDNSIRTLTEVITYYRMACDTVVEGDPNVPLYQSNLGGALSTYALRTGHLESADEAVRICRLAMDTIATDDARTALLWANLAAAHAARAQLPGRSEGERRFDTSEAIRLWSAATEFVSCGAFLRMEIALEWAEFAEKLAGTTKAAEAYAALARLVPQLVWRGLDQRRQEELLGGRQELVRDAAARCLADSQCGLAIELLEEGRSVLWTQRLEMQTDLERLRAQHGDVANRLAHIRSSLKSL